MGRKGSNIGYVYSSRHKNKGQQEGPRCNITGGGANVTFATGNTSGNSGGDTSCISTNHPSSSVVDVNEQISSFYSEKILYCSCEGGNIQREIDCLSESTDAALYQSYSEVDELTAKFRAQKEEIANLTQRLKESKDREKQMSRRYEKSKKNALLVRNGGRSGLIRSSSSASSLASQASFALRRISSSQQSSNSMFTLKRPTATSTCSSSNDLSSPNEPQFLDMNVPKRCATSVTDLSSIQTRRVSIGSDCSSLNQNERWDCTENGAKQVQSLLMKRLESRDREITSLEELVQSNVKNIQELQLKLHKKKDKILSLEELVNSNVKNIQEQLHAKLHENEGWGVPAKF